MTRRRPSSSPADVGVRVAVDRIKCDGHGQCAELLPELIRLDDWGYPIIARADVRDHLAPLAQRAVAGCPVLALALRQRTG
jgi:ferredoxin